MINTILMTDDSRLNIRDNVIINDIPFQKTSFPNTFTFLIDQIKKSHHGFLLIDDGSNKCFINTNHIVKILEDGQLE